MTREHKLALILGFALVLVVGVLISDHFSGARRADAGGMNLAQVEGMPQTEVGLGRQAQWEDPASLTDDAPSLPETRPDWKPIPPADEPPTSALAGAWDGLANEFKGAIQDLGAGRVPVSASQTDVLVMDQKPAQPVTPAEDTAVRRHDVREGDTLWSIAQRYYNDGSLHKKLAEYNADRLARDGTLRVGATILIPSREVLTGQKPATEPVSDPAPAPAPSAKPGAYTVKKGDTLSSIARRELGAAGRWDEILELNSDLLEDETSLQVGMVLKLPARRSAD